jgi:putative salt-induced outer membrane protein
MAFVAVNRARRGAIGLAVAVLAIGAPAHADWVGKGEGGLVLSRGNADSTSANAKLDIAEEQNGWKNSILVAGLYGRNATFATAQRLEGRYQLDHKISDGLFWFGAVRGERDLFSGFEYQMSLSGGLGYKFIDSADTKLAGTLGVGYRRLRPEQLVKDPAGQVIERIPGEVSGNAVATAGLDFSHQVTKTTKLVDKLNVESGKSNTSVANDFGVQVSMTDRLALAFGYGVRYNSDPAPGNKRTDQLTTVNIVYNIK